MTTDTLPKDHALEAVPEVARAMAALRRAAEVARQIAFLTGTDVIVMVNGRPAREAGSEGYDRIKNAQPASRRRPSSLR
ncbi:MAG: hypothetical protein RL456_2691 [Pseudomonadota bacterium]|jgi:hypothetical protein